MGHRDIRHCRLLSGEGGFQSNFGGLGGLLGRPRRKDAGIRGLGSQRGVWMLKEQGWELSQQ